MSSQRKNVFKFHFFFFFRFFILLSIFLVGFGACQTSAAEVRKGISPQCPQPRSTQKAPEGIHSQKNPLKKTIRNLKAGERLFQNDAKPLTCNTCHGVQGDGLGDPDFESTPPARNFTCSETMRGVSDGQLFWVIKNGIPHTAMPSFIELSNDDIWKLILYIRQFSRSENELSKGFLR